MALRWSRYNRIVRSEKYGYLLYNSLSSTLAMLDPAVNADLEVIRQGPDSYDFTANPGLYLQLRLTKVLVEEDEEEDLLRVIRLRAMSEDHDLSRLALIIAPTLGCNFECTYCYEKSRRPVHMDDRTERQVVTFARSFRSARQLYLCWYGGEPLLRFKTILSLTERLKALNIPLTAQLITNGYLLNDRVINELDGLKIKSIQVTIDGRRETHDRRRVHVTHGATYDTILSNLEDLTHRWKGDLDIRVNVDRDNIEEFTEVRSELSRRLQGDNVSIYPGIVDHGVIRNPDSSCRFTRQEEVDFLFELYRRHGIAAGEFYPVRSLGCMALRSNSFLIGPQGELYNCTHDLGEPDMVVGSIFEGQRWNLPLLARYMVGVNPLDDPTCRECFYLPVCHGGCPHFRLRRIYNAEDFITCPIYKDRLTEALEVTIETSRSEESERKVPRQEKPTLVSP